SSPSAGCLPRRCNKREREFFSSSRPAPLPIHGERLFLCLRGGRERKIEFIRFIGIIGIIGIMGGVAIIDAYFLSEPPFENYEKYKSANTRPAC
ncbi:hypothetical protein, partial [Akkermansia sp. NBRC 115031]|uniref:hypothetical protein n=1 Tax=Akkermansia sp. NBRC 115031 TaxID=2994522 RepID=UPI0025564F2F